MKRSLATLVVILAGGCSVAPAGVVLIFPNAQDKTDATQATLIVSQPPSATGDLCSQYVSFPPLDPDPAIVELTEKVGLVNGASMSALPKIPVGRQTLLVKVADKTGNIFLHGCLTATINSGSSLQITLQPLGQAVPDLQMVVDAAVDMAGPVDMARNKYLAITVSELRASTRKLDGVSVTITDSAGTTVGPTMTDVNGLAKINTLGLVPPLDITASAPLANNYQGAATLSGVNPTFTSDTVAMSLPVELDPPATLPNTPASNVITVTPNDGAGGHNFDIYWLGGNELPSDFNASHHATTTSNAAGTAQPLVSGVNYRVATLENGQSAIATPPGVTNVGGALTPQIGGGGVADFKSYAGAAGTALALSATKSASAAYNVSQQYGVAIILPAPPAQVPVPLIAETAIAAGNPQATINVPMSPTGIQFSASLETELVAIGTTARAELRHQFSNASPASDSLSGLPDPPVVTPASPATEAAATSFTVSAPQPTGFTGGSTAFVHIHIHNSAAPNFHWHMIAPAASPTTITVPAGVLPTGMYTMDVAFVQDFSPLSDGTIQATLTDDYSKLLRVVPQELSQSSISLTVN